MKINVTKDAETRRQHGEAKTGKTKRKKRKKIERTRGGAGLKARRYRGTGRQVERERRGAREGGTERSCDHPYICSIKGFPIRLMNHG